MKRLPSPQTRRVLARNLRRIRFDRGLSQDELAREAELTQALVSAIELAEANPTLASLDRLATALGVGIIDLFQIKQ